MKKGNKSTYSGTLCNSIVKRRQTKNAIFFRENVHAAPHGNYRKWVFDYIFLELIVYVSDMICHKDLFMTLNLWTCESFNLWQSISYFWYCKIIETIFWSTNKLSWTWMLWAIQRLQKKYRHIWIVRDS